MEIKVELKPMVTCPASAKITELAANGAVELPVFVVKDAVKRMYFVYAEDILPANKFGRVEKIDGKLLRGNEDLTEKLDSAISDGSYTMRVTGNGNGGLLSAILKVNSAAVGKSSNGESEALEKAWNDAYKLGGPFTKEYHDTVMEFFSIHEVDENLQLRIVSGYKLPIDEDGKELNLEKPASMWQPTNTLNEKALYFESYASVALEQAMDGNPFIFEGPKSVGKNFLDEWIAYVLGAVYYEISVDPDMSKAELYGDKVIDDTSAKNLNRENSEAYLCFQNGLYKDEDTLKSAAEHEYWSKYNETMRFIVESTEFKRWLRQKSGRRVLMVNEINYGNPTVLAVVFNRVAEDRPVRFIDVPGEGRIYIGRDCVLTASMNRDYVGTVELNEAMRSRFGVIEMQPSAHIKGILKDKIESEFGKGKLPDAYYKACDDLYVYMVARASSAGSSAQYGDKAVSIRGFIRALRTVALKGSRKPKILCAQLNLQLRGQCDTEQERASLTDDINDHVGNL